MSFDRKTYNAGYHKENTKIKAVRFTNEEVVKVESFCQSVGMGYSELIRKLLYEEMARCDFQADAEDKGNG